MRVPQEQHFPACGNDTFQHLFDIVVSVRRLLVGPSRKNSVRQEKYRDAALRIELADRMREAQAVEDAFRTVRGIVEDEEKMRRMSSCSLH